MANQIDLRISDGTQYDEAKAGATIYPGMRGVYNSSGAIIPNGTLGQKGPVLIPRADVLQGKTTTDPYASGDVVGFFIPVVGDHFLVLVKSGQNLTFNDRLHADASGKYIKTTGAEDPAIGQSDFIALETTGALGADKLVRAQKI